LVLTADNRKQQLGLPAVPQRRVGQSLVEMLGWDGAGRQTLGS